MASLLTIVFTDVVGSSAIKRDLSLGHDSRERDHAYLEAVQTPHFKLIRESSKTHEGREVNTMGDAFYLTFDDPLQAIRCAADIQRQLAYHPIDTPRGALRLRIGIHSGYPEPFEGGYQGADVDMAARVQGVAKGGQILLSSATYQLVRGMTDVKFHRMGEFALKGVDRDVLWEVNGFRGVRRNWIERALSWIRSEKLRAACVAGALVILIVFWISRPSAARWYNNRGVNFQQRGDVTTAIKNYQHALTLKSDYAEAHYNLADAYEEISDYDRATAEYQRAIRSDATFYPAYNNLSRLYILRRNDYTAALELLDHALNLRPQEVSVQYSLYKNHGWANLGLHLLGQAELDLRRALALEHHRGAAHCLLALVLEAQGRPSPAMREWEPCAAYASGDRDVEPDWRSRAQERLKQGEVN
jgi:class 3 adenylate cyclase/Tfp pilus assembly protein PilF